MKVKLHFKLALCVMETWRPKSNRQNNKRNENYSVTKSDLKTFYFYVVMSFL